MYVVVSIMFKFLFLITTWFIGFSYLSIALCCCSLSNPKVYLVSVCSQKVCNTFQLYSILLITFCKFGRYFKNLLNLITCLFYSLESYI